MVAKKGVAKVVGKVVAKVDAKLVAKWVAFPAWGVLRATMWASGPATPA